MDPANTEPDHPAISMWTLAEEEDQDEPTSPPPHSNADGVTKKTIPSDASFGPLDDLDFELPNIRNLPKDMDWSELRGVKY